MRSSIEITRTGNTNSVTIVEGEPFTLQCTATESGNKDIIGKFRWDRDDITVSSSRAVSLEEKNVIINETTAEGKRKSTYYSICLKANNNTNSYIGIYIYIYIYIVNS